METIDITNISGLLTYFNGILDKGISKPQPVPAPLILSGIANKSGLSARDITKEIIVKSQAIGIPIGALPDGSESLWEKQIYLIVETIVEHIIKNAKVTVAIPPGIAVSTSGASATGPVLSQGATTTFATAYAVIQ